MYDIIKEKTGRREPCTRNLPSLRADLSLSWLSLWSLWWCVAWLDQDPPDDNFDDYCSDQAYYWQDYDDDITVMFMMVYVVVFYVCSVSAKSGQTWIAGGSAWWALQTWWSLWSR